MLESNKIVETFFEVLTLNIFDENWVFFVEIEKNWFGNLSHKNNSKYINWYHLVVMK